MSDERRRSIYLSKVLLSLLLLLIGFTLAGMYASSQRDAAARAPLVGTWKSEKGGFWNLRPSGTARARWSSAPGKILYFDWTFDGNEFAIYQYGRRNGFGKWYLLIRRSTIGVRPTDRYTVVEKTPTCLRFCDPSTGEIYTCTAVEDAEVENAR